jgi:hypothetical protein
VQNGGFVFHRIFIHTNDGILRHGADPCEDVALISQGVIHPDGKPRYL